MTEAKRRENLVESNRLGVPTSLSFSIVTAVRNRVDTVVDALRSVARQRWDNIQHIVVDGASVDGTLELLEAHKQQTQVLISEPDKGIYDALNKGVSLADGDVIGFMHSDDQYAHDHVLAQVARAFADLSIDGVYGDIDYVARSNTARVIRRWRAGEYERKHLRRGWMPPHTALFLRRSVFERWGGFDTRYEISADYDAVLRYLVRGNIRLTYVPSVLVKMRWGGESNRSVGRIIRKNYEDYLVLRRNSVGGCATLLMKNVSKLPQLRWTR